MLKIELDLRRIATSQGVYRQLGTMEGIGFALKVMALRKALEQRIKRFQQRQEKASQSNKPVLQNGDQITIIDNVLKATGTIARSRRAAEILQGIHLPVAHLLPDLPCRDKGPNWSTCDDSTYLTQLDDGPPRARQFGDTTSLVLYLAPLNTIHILWIGAESDLANAKKSIMVETSNWTDWTSMSQRYADWLKAACHAPIPDNP